MLRLPFLAGGLMAAALLAAFPLSSAGAAVIIAAFLGGPFSSLNPIGTLPATFVQSANTYDFTFSLVAPVTGISATQVAAIANGSTRANEQIQYQIYEGVPTTADPENGTLLATSLDTFSPTVFINLAPGSYYVNVLPADIAVNGEVLSGSFVTAPATIPEPAAWALMMLGVGLAGANLRSRRSPEKICMPA